MSSGNVFSLVLGVLRPRNKPHGLTPLRNTLDRSNTGGGMGTALFGSQLSSDVQRKSRFIY